MRDAVISIIDVLYSVPYLPEIVGLTLLISFLAWAFGGQEEGDE